MNKFEETLVILNHYGGIINGRTDYCKRNSNFKISEYVTNRIFDKRNQGFSEEEINEKFVEEISRDCADKKVILHNYICLNIIDMFSFNDEYEKYFNCVNVNAENLKFRISKVLKENSKLKKQIDWNQLKRFRNNILAHNLRDDKNDYKLSISTFKELSNYTNNIETSIKYFEVVLNMFDNIKSEFDFEIQQAFNKLKALLAN